MSDRRRAPNWKQPRPVLPGWQLGQCEVWAMRSRHIFNRCEVVRIVRRELSVDGSHVVVVRKAVRA